MSCVPLSLEVKLSSKLKVSLLRLLDFILPAQQMAIEKVIYRNDTDYFD